MIDTNGCFVNQIGDYSCSPRQILTAFLYSINYIYLLFLHQQQKNHNLQHNSKRCSFNNIYFLTHHKPLIQMDLSTRIKQTYYKKMKLKKQPTRALQYGHNQSVLIDNFTFQNLYPLFPKQQHHKTQDNLPVKNQRKMSKVPPKIPSKSVNNPKSYQSCSERKLSGDKEKPKKDKKTLIIQTKTKKKPIPNNQKPQQTLKLQLVQSNPVNIQNLVFDPTRSNRRKDIKINTKLKRSIKCFSEAHSRKDFIAAINRQFIPGEIMKMQNYVPKFMPWITSQKFTMNTISHNKTFYQSRKHMSNDRTKSLSRFTDVDRSASKARWEKVGGSISPWDQLHQL